jgi:hypothetical protein
MRSPAANERIDGILDNGRVVVRSGFWRNDELTITPWSRIGPEPSLAPDPFRYEPDLPGEPVARTEPKQVAG